MEGCCEVVDNSDPIQLLLMYHLRVRHNYVQKSDLHNKPSHRMDGSPPRFPWAALQTEMGYYGVN